MENTTTNAVGLSSEEAAESRRKHGEDILTPPTRKSMWRLYLEKYDGPIIKILLVVAIVSSVLVCIEQEFVETMGMRIMKK